MRLRIVDCGMRIETHKMILMAIIRKAELITEDKGLAMNTDKLKRRTEAVALRVMTRINPKSEIPACHGERGAGRRNPQCPKELVESR